ncbi:DUF4179 domain-containing protein [Paenibacillus graminis]|uniref:Tat pathway signal protein n=1 Tax=Paenibacillus graminis TaxID=189425 RepID=A0A089ND09_9BACL|nr:DUF4179 domain-containing protein [Paenibacillus graminis]AIQ66849.1 hypothetical protein PGRAT_03725 [Paenibacillus graminis]
MEKWQNPTDSQKTEDIRQALRDHKMPVDSYSSQIMKRIGELDVEKRKSTKRGSNVLKKTLFAASSAAALGAGIIGTGFVSPVMADTLKQIPIVGNVFKIVEDKGLKAAADKGLSTVPNQSVTHDGVTLKITNAYYDGSRLALAFEREGIDNEEMLGKITIEPIKFDPAVKEKHANTILDQSVKGLLGLPIVKLPDGKEISYGSGSTGDVKGQKNTLLYDLRNLNNTAAFGDEFVLSVSVPVTQVAEPFEFKVPLKKVTEGIVRLDLNQTKTTGEFSYTIKKLELTPATSRLVVDQEGKIPSSPKPAAGYSVSEMFYELSDDQGTAFTSSGSFLLPAIVYPIVDRDFDPFPQGTKKITVKPFTYSIDHNLEPLMDAEGNKVKTYYPELEQTIQIPQKNNK